MIFLLYDLFVERRNRKLIASAARSNAIVTQLFPGNIRDQVIAEQEEKQVSKASAKYHLKSFVDGKSDGMEKKEVSQPLAELFLETTIMFADVVG